MQTMKRLRKNWDGRRCGSLRAERWGLPTSERRQEMKMDANCRPLALATCNLNMAKTDRPKSGWWKHGGERLRLANCFGGRARWRWASMHDDPLARCVFNDGTRLAFDGQ